jgi:hypothetical protein
MKISRTIFVAILCAGTLAMLSSPGVISGLQIKRSTEPGNIPKAVV